MDLKIVNPQSRYGRVRLIEPPALGYIQVAAAVEPPARGPLPGRSAGKRALLANLKSLAGQLEGLETVEKARSTARPWCRHRPATRRRRRPTWPATTWWC